MTEEYEQRARIFQQAMESCHSNNPTDYIEWFTDRIVELEAQIEQFQKINNEQKETLKKVRVALIKERAANIINYGKGGAEMFDSIFEILKDISN